MTGHIEMQADGRRQQTEVPAHRGRKELTTMTTTPSTALITGASTGIGAAYADRFARRGHDLVLVARDQARLEAVAARLGSETSRRIEVLPADLTDRDDLSRVETRLREDEGISLLVNNAGAAPHGGFAAPDLEEWERLIGLNVLAMTRLTGAVVPRFLVHGGGAIINLSSVVALAPEIPLGIYGATKAYALALSQSLQAELGSRGIYVQAVLPGATRTEIWERSGRDVNGLQAAMEVDELVDAALVGFDRRELVTIPPLHDVRMWEDFTAARQAIRPNIVQAHAAERYHSRAA
jgi:short-subunit dehydrogenase